MNYKNPFELDDKAVLITGASSGIGRQCAISCSYVGADVILLGRNKKRLEETKDLLKDSSKCSLYQFDLTDPTAVSSFIIELKKNDTKIDGIINAAGISTTLPFKLSTMEKQELLFKTNVYAPINLTRELSKKNGILSDGSSIVFISSIMATVGEVGKTLYGMSKGALVAATKSIALELAPRRIRVNTISPGVIDTPMSEQSAYSKDEESFKKITSKHPLGIGSPEDVAHACIYLLSSASKWVTGTDLIIDGGYTAK